MNNEELRYIFLRKMEFVKNDRRAGAENVCLRKRDIFSLARKCDMRLCRAIFACGERYAAYGGVRETNEGWVLSVGREAYSSRRS